MKKLVSMKSWSPLTPIDLPSPQPEAVSAAAPHPREEAAKAFLAEVEALSQKHGFGFYLEPAVGGYDPGVEEDAYLCVCERLPGSEEITNLPWFDLAAENERERRQQEWWARCREEEAEKYVRAREFAPQLAKLFVEHQLALETDRRAGVQIVPFSEGRWQNLRGAPLKVWQERRSASSPALDERALNAEHEAALPAFWEALEALCCEEGLIPSCEEAPRTGFYSFCVSPLFGDLLPKWLADFV